MDVTLARVSLIGALAEEGPTMEPEMACNFSVEDGWLPWRWKYKSHLLPYPEQYGFVWAMKAGWDKPEKLAPGDIPYDLSISNLYWKPFETTNFEELSNIGRSNSSHDEHCKSIMRVALKQMY